MHCTERPGRPRQGVRAWIVGDLPVACGRVAVLGEPMRPDCGGVASAAEVHGAGDGLLRIPALADERLCLAEQTRGRLVAPPA